MTAPTRLGGLPLVASFRPLWDCEDTAQSWTAGGLEKGPATRWQGTALVAQQSPW